MPSTRDTEDLRDKRFVCDEGDIHIDHILPVSLGGLSELSNLQVTHSWCNLKKGARVLGGDE